MSGFLKAVEENEEEEEDFLTIEEQRFLQRPTSQTPHLYLFVLPVLLLEFLALAITRAILPSIILHHFQDGVYFIMGCAECVKGLLAFLACPLFGKISDVVGRKACLFLTVLGTCAPVCSLAIMNSYDNQQRIWIFVYLFALSGLFSSTFTLVFAYITDVVPDHTDRVAAYGLALATFGLSNAIGPAAGGYLSRVDHVLEDTLTLKDEDTFQVNKEAASSFQMVDPIGQQRVFICSLILTLADLMYIYFILPESRQRTNGVQNGKENEDTLTLGSITTTSIQERWETWKEQVLLNQSWSPLDALRLFSGDPLLAEVGVIAFLYYTGVWAVISTMVIYAVKRFHFGPERLGELVSAFGFCTMIAEAVFLRIFVPCMGEKAVVKLGLLAFAAQCMVLGLANRGWQLFICVALSMLSNLVYPSLASFVSKMVAPHVIGEALGAINGVKALTEGIGPLVFGGMMTLSEKSNLPGWPYLIAGLFSIIAYQRTKKLPEEDTDIVMSNYINEKFSGAKSNRRREGRVHNLMELLDVAKSHRSKGVVHEEEGEEELCGLLTSDDGGDEGTEHKGFSHER
jgi:DHA1 family tetracycline resistance protein-like MFS transporter